MYYRLTAEDFRYRMEKARVQCVVTCREGPAAGFYLGRGGDRPGPHRSPGPQGDRFAGLLADLPRQPDTLDRVETQVTDPLLLYFTSGTTGLPKGVLHDHAFPLANYWGARYMQDVHKGSRHFATGDTGWEVVSGTKFYGQWLLQGTLLVYDYRPLPRKRSRLPLPGPGHQHHGPAHGVPPAHPGGDGPV